MFVLRFHEPDPESGPQPDNRPMLVSTHEGARARRARQGSRPVWPGHGGGLPEVPNPDDDASGPASKRAIQQRSASMPMPLFAAAFAVRFGGAKAALECPKHIADVQTLIDKVSAEADRNRNRTPWDRLALVHALLDDARMLLEAARVNHEQPQGPYDHARAFAKADAALGHARAAEIACSRCTRE